MKSKIKETANAMNVSNELLRHYERLGLIHPVRNESGYREYAQQDVEILTGILRYKNMDIPLEQIKTLIYEGSLETLEETLSQKIEDFEWNLKKQQAILQSMIDCRRELENVKANLHEIELTTSPAIVRFSLFSKTRIMSEIAGEKNRQFTDLLPISFISPVVRKQDWTNENSQIEFGFGITLNDFQEFQLTWFENYENHPSCLAYSFLIETIGEDRLNLAHFHWALEYVCQQGYEVNGDCWGYTLGNCVDKDKEHHRFHRFYLPVIKRG
ncbi:MerR family transcriptional regulator [Holdemania massiliensis]|uniref:MerR family transcriptional regulator n=1 Tax=Holdemania massiliensis TaxID=1468449 RepID=UPI001F050E56|nr:MerR family transcriptional regulator [Holdemania massiliensis]MCH1942688.1 MerR family transcriptional regulator [Holdemania massiliensis]